MLTVLIGINDTARRYDEADPTSTADFEADYASILDQARRVSGLDRLVLMEPFLVPFTADQARWHEEDLNEKIAVVRDLAFRFDAELIPLDAIFAEAAASQGARTLLADGIHPTDAGNELLARTWWEAASTSPPSAESSGPTGASDPNRAGSAPRPRGRSAGRAVARLR